MTTETKSETAMTTTNDAEMEQFDYGEEAGQGYDKESAGDIQIPFITVLQALSPQVRRVDKGGIEGAEIGMLYNNVTNELMDSVRFVPAISAKQFVEWKTRQEGGGFVASHDLSSKLIQDFKASGDRGPWKTNGGKHEIQETQYLYCIEVDEADMPTGGFFVLSFTSTKLSAWRKWNTAIHTFRVATPSGNLVQPPLYAHVVELTSKEQNNKHGDFFNFLLSPANGAMNKSLVGPNSPAFVDAKALREKIEAGVAKAVTQSEKEPSGGGYAKDDDDGEDSF